MYAKGITRREILIDTAAELLDERSVEEISLKLIADTAGVPVGSAYHFYTNSNEVFAALAQRFGAELAAEVAAPYSEEEAETWQTMWSTAIDRAVALYKEKPAYAQLIIGGKASPEIKLSDRANDERVGQLFVGVINQHFDFPEFPGRHDMIFFAVEIVDLLLSLSVIRHGEITDKMAAEAKRASIAYLRTYLPDSLAERLVPAAND
jgi:AcrR family transcriptional regulator